LYDEYPKAFCHKYSGADGLTNHAVTFFFFPADTSEIFAPYLWLNDRLLLFKGHWYSSCSYKSEFEQTNIPNTNSLTRCLL